MTYKIAPRLKRDGRFDAFNIAGLGEEPVWLT
jgi:hypothetical protein